MERLVGEGGDVDATDDYGETALIASCRHGHEEVAAVLIDGGAQVNKANKYKETPLHFASRNGRSSCVSLIIGEWRRRNSRRYYRYIYVYTLLLTVLA